MTPTEVPEEERAALKAHADRLAEDPEFQREVARESHPAVLALEAFLARTDSHSEAEFIRDAAAQVKQDVDTIDRITKERDEARAAYNIGAFLAEGDDDSTLKNAIARIAELEAALREARREIAELCAVAYGKDDPITIDAKHLLEGPGEK